MRKPRGYWENLENVTRELIPLIKKYGRFPSNREMQKDVSSSLPRYIAKYHGGSIKLSKDLGVKTYDESIGRRSANTWIKNDVIREFKKIILDKDLDYFPSRNELKNWGIDIMIGITQTFGTYTNFKKQLKKTGYNLNPKKRNYKWTDSRIKKTLQNISFQLGHFPSNSDLDKLGYSTLRNLLINSPGIKKELLLSEDIIPKKRKYTTERPSGYWNKSKNVENEIIKVYNKFGRIPSANELMKLGYGSLSTHIKNINSDFLSKYDYFDNSKYFKTKDGDKVLSVYELLFDNFLSFNNIKHETEGLISDKISNSYRFDFKLYIKTSIVYVEIWGFSSGNDERSKSYQIKMSKKKKVYNKLGLTLLEINDVVFEKSFDKIYHLFNSYIKRINPDFKPKEIDLDYLLYGSKFSIDNVSYELKQIITKNEGYFPTTSQLKKINGGEGLISRIQKYGGVQVFKNILGVDIKPRDNKWTVKFLKSELYSINKLLYIPSTNDLEIINRLDVVGGIQKNGGVNKLSQLWGIPTKREFLTTQPKIYRGKWNEELIISELSIIIDNLGYFPKEKDLKYLNRVDLFVGIKRFGGMRKFRKKFGFNLR